MGPGGRHLREAVRAVVIDGRDRVLVRLALAEGPLWAASGGGIDDGERPEEAIRRELYEEVGLVDVDLGPMIWTRTHWFPLSPDFDGQRETFFLVRGDGSKATPSFSDAELRAEGLTGSRWWTATDLADSEERFARRQLPELYARLLREGPGEVIDTGV